jgi:hypothetical protein
MKQVREFDTGANRDIDDDKLDYEAFISPKVLEAYAKYMHKNRFLKDGSIRAGDNWQKGFGDEHYSVCMKSLSRHFMDLWLLHRGYEARESMEDALNGIMFNVMAYYFKYLEEKE